jgi:hypothetical protein
MLDRPANHAGRFAVFRHYPSKLSRPRASRVLITPPVRRPP